MYKLGFFVPPENAEAVKTALFEAGGGRIGEYEHCAWQAMGQGQFRPGAAANPHIGAPGKLEVLPELRVELVVADAHIRAVIAALKQSHPYETPAYDVIRLEDF